MFHFLSNTDVTFSLWIGIESPQMSVLFLPFVTSLTSFIGYPICKEGVLDMLSCWFPSCASRLPPHEHWASSRPWRCNCLHFPDGEGCGTGFVFTHIWLPWLSVISCKSTPLLDPSGLYPACFLGSFRRDYLTADSLVLCFLKCFCGLFHDVCKAVAKRDLL